MGLRKGMPELPERMKGLAVSEKGYPVPYFVEYIDGKPDFRVVSPSKFLQCIRYEKCWICGQKLGRYRTFVGGPMMAINGLSSEPPSHRECAEFALKVCPFLVLPKSQRRGEEIENTVPMHGDSMLLHNPGAGVLVVTEGLGYQIQREPGGTFVFRLTGRGEMVWWAEGKPATRSQVIDAIDRSVAACKEQFGYMNAYDIERLEAAAARLKGHAVLLPDEVQS